MMGELPSKYRASHKICIALTKIFATAPLGPPLSSSVNINPTYSSKMEIMETCILYHYI